MVCLPFVFDTMCQPSSKIIGSCDVALIPTWFQIVYWFSHAPTLTGVLSFVCPLLILPLLASAYAEVNYEGQNLVQAIMPTEDRTHIFRWVTCIQVLDVVPFRDRIETTEKKLVRLNENFAIGVKIKCSVYSIGRFEILIYPDMA